MVPAVIIMIPVIVIVVPVIVIVVSVIVLLIPMAHCTQLYLWGLSIVRLCPTVKLFPVCVVQSAHPVPRAAYELVVRSKLSRIEVFLKQLVVFIFFLARSYGLG